MQDGRRTEPSPSLDAVRQRAAGNLAALPPTLRSPLAKGDYEVTISARLEAMAAAFDGELGV